MITLDDFKNTIVQIAKPNRFTVEIVYNESVYDNPKADPFVDIMTEGATTFLKELQYLVQDASIPNRTQNNITVKYHGMKLELPGDFDHTDLTVKFINRANWRPREFFFTWMEMIQSTSTWSFFSEGVNKRLNSTLIFQIFPKIIVRQIGNSEEEILATYVFYNAFPKELSDIRLSMSDENIETFDVTFAYSHYERVYDLETDFLSTSAPTSKTTKSASTKARVDQKSSTMLGKGSKNALEGETKPMSAKEKNQRELVKKYSERDEVNYKKTFG